MHRPRERVSESHAVEFSTKPLKRSSKLNPCRPCGDQTGDDQTSHEFSGLNKPNRRIGTRFLLRLKPAAGKPAISAAKAAGF
jgi:hypothetical protein